VIERMPELTAGMMTLLGIRPISMPFSLLPSYTLPRRHDATRDDPVLESCTGRSERMLEGPRGGIGGSRFYRFLVGGSQLEQRRNYVWYWPRGPVSDRSPLGFITIVRMLRKAYVGAGVEGSREEHRRVHAWQINRARSYGLGG
jgi:hypothetical protein